MSRRPSRAATGTENFPGADITPAEWEFLRALEAFQRRTGRRYPSGREVLGVLLGLGYRKPADAPPPPPEGRP